MDKVELILLCSYTNKEHVGVFLIKTVVTFYLHRLLALKKTVLGHLFHLIQDTGLVIQIFL